MNDMLPRLAEARRDFHVALKSTILWVKPLTKIKRAGIRKALAPDIAGPVSIADLNNTSSITIAWEWAKRLSGTFAVQEPNDDSGKLFQDIVRDFLQRGFDLGLDIRPGDWHLRTQRAISHFDQYSHLDDIARTLKGDNELRTIFSEQFLVIPDIVVYRTPLRGVDAGREPGSHVASLSPLLDDAQLAKGHPLLHASVSTKITMRSDRAQNSRTEALNLIRNRKGRLPAIVAVTAEPLPTRLASLALGTGDVDFVYHAGLPELRESVAAVGNEDQLDMLNTIVQGRRLRDISDLVLDLLI
jgi:hypothetical protein